MKKLLICASLIALSTSAFAGTDGMYVRADLGASKMKIESKAPGSAKEKANNDAKILYNLGIGYKFNENIRSDLNFQMRDSKIEKNGHTFKGSKPESYTVFLNGYYDFKTGSMFTPYLTAGVGISKNKMKKLAAGTSDDSSTEFGWNAGLGSKINLSSNFDLDIAYRYVDLGEFKTKASGTTTKHDATAHEVMAGVIYNF